MRKPDYLQQPDVIALPPIWKGRTLGPTTWDETAAPAEFISRSEFLAVLRMLVKRATWHDRWRARRYPRHWLNAARREILIG